MWYTAHGIWHPNSFVFLLGICGRSIVFMEVLLLFRRCFVYNFVAEEDSIE